MNCHLFDSVIRSGLDLDIGTNIRFLIYNAVDRKCWLEDLNVMDHRSETDGYIVKDAGHGTDRQTPEARVRF